LRVESTRAAAPPAAVRERRRLLSEDLFHSILRKERTRAARARHGVGLVLISADRRRTNPGSCSWPAIVEAIERVTRDTDVVGWFAQGRVLGVIQPDIDGGDAAADAEGRLRGAIAARPDAGTPAVRVHRLTHAADDGTPWPVDVRRAAGRTIKRALDIVGSVALLVLLSPVFLLIALVAKMLSPGPLLFGQTRIGEGMKPFTMLKFRTMHTGADPGLHRDYVTRFIKSGSAPPEPGSLVFKITVDPRVTPVGRVLRKTSLDELPQLWNVLRGEMSLVGPRPPLPYEVEQYQAWHCRRVVDAKPGITGLWQVAGRSRTTFDEMVRLDLRYARTCSFWTDVKILLATPRAVISGKGAC
jgi:lipopolysaccharide/colanic/teichoic acid biosynthesis glycosyltransferase